MNLSGFSAVTATGNYRYVLTGENSTQMHTFIKCLFFCGVVLTIIAPCHSDDSVKLLFKDDFQRDESQNGQEEPGNGWSTNSKKRAGGHKQVDLKDGALVITRHESADHAVSLVHAAKYRDCRVQLRFRIDDKRDDLGIDFADMQCKEVHAGHIAKVFFRASGVEIFDFRNGRMNRSYRDAVAGDRVTPEQKAILKNSQRSFRQSIALNEWHSASITLRSDVISVELDGKSVGSFQSSGIGHPTKDMIRFSARQNLWLDDIRVEQLVDPGGPRRSMPDEPVRHLFGARLLLRKFETVDLTEEQRAKFNRLSGDLRNRVDARRDKVGITQDLIRQRDKVYSRLRDEGLKDETLWTTLQAEINLTDAQRDAFRDTLRQNKEFRANAMKLLTKDQRSRLPKKNR